MEGILDWFTNYQYYDCRKQPIKDLNAGYFQQINDQGYYAPADSEEMCDQWIYEYSWQNDLQNCDVSGSQNVFYDFLGMFFYRLLPISKTAK